MEPDAPAPDLSNGRQTLGNTLERDTPEDGRLRLIATISDPRVAERLVAHLARAPGSPTTPRSRPECRLLSAPVLSVCPRRPRP